MNVQRLMKVLAWLPWAVTVCVIAGGIYALEHIADRWLVGRGEQPQPPYIAVASSTVSQGADWFRWFELFVKSGP